jgi:hypothetical protein
MKIAWNIDGKDIQPPPTIEDKIRTFYERILGWQLHIADLLANGGQPLGKSHPIDPVEHSGFAVLHICLSYFETIGHYEHGDPPAPATGVKGYFFKEGAKSVLPQLGQDYGEEEFEQLLDRLYVGVRCGLYHNSMTKVGVGLGPPSLSGAPISYDPETKALTVNPQLLPEVLKKHLEQFRIRLLDPANDDLRRGFEKRFDEDNGIPKKRS